jgi:phage gpG-like protein
MSTQLSITLNPEAHRLLARSPQWPAALRTAIAKTLDLQLALTVGQIQAKRLTGRGPFDPVEGRLGVRTNRLRSSLYAAPAQIQGNTISASIGSNVRYAGLHEFGATVTKTTKPGSIRLKATKGGELYRQKGGRLAIFAKKTDKNARTVATRGGRSFTVTIPERAPIRRGIQDRLPQIGTAFSRAIVNTLTGPASDSAT